MFNDCNNVNVKLNDTIIKYESLAFPRTIAEESTFEGSLDTFAPCIATLLTATAN